MDQRGEKHLFAGTRLSEQTKMFLLKKPSKTVDIAGTLCGILGVKVWDCLREGFPNLN